MPASIETPVGTLHVGDRVWYRPWFGQGEPCEATVSLVSEDIKNGKPGFDTTDGGWAYAHQLDHIF